MTDRRSAACGDLEIKIGNAADLRGPVTARNGLS